MAGRPSLRIGQHGRISRKHLGGGVWVARTRYRDTDGVTRIVERRGPADDYDKHGKLAEDALVEALTQRQPPTSGGAVSGDTLLTELLTEHLRRLAEDGRSPATLATYTFAVDKLKKFVGGVRVREAHTARIDAALRSMRAAHGATMARQCKTVVRGALQLAVMPNVIATNPARDVDAIKSATQSKGANALTAAQLRTLLADVVASEFCQQRDLADPIILLIATGIRRSELLALRWIDFDEDAAALRVEGKLVRATGTGLTRLANTKSAAGQRTLLLPSFAVTMLESRRNRAFYGQQPMLFPAASGTWRDPNNFGKQWRNVRDELGVPEITSHSFRKTLADLIDESGLSARIGADQLGHSRVSMTQDRYMTRGRIHTEVADLLDKAISDE